MVIMVTITKLNTVVAHIHHQKTTRATMVTNEKKSIQTEIIMIVTKTKVANTYTTITTVVILLEIIPIDQPI